VLAEALVSLASVGGSALVSAMVTDGWEGVRGRVASLLGRGDASGEQRAATQLDQSRAALAGSDGATAERTRAEQEIIWRTRLTDLLERDPGAEQDLRTMLAEVQTLVTTSAGRVDQHAVAFGQAQQAVLGQGTQHVSFGGQHGPGGSAG
jgi:hypothetical protein